jgi:hypothetical protein
MQRERGTRNSNDEELLGSLIISIISARRGCGSRCLSASSGWCLMGWGNAEDWTDGWEGGNKTSFFVTI